MSNDTEAALAALFNSHRPDDERDEHNLPLCSCGHSLGWFQTWGEHMAKVFAQATEATSCMTASRDTEAAHTAEKDRSRTSLADLAVQPRDEVIAQVMAFLLERGYTITAPDGQHVTPSAKASS